MTFSERMASLRFSGETQKEFADRLGMTQATTSRYLSHYSPAPEALQKIAEKTGVSVEWLLGGKELPLDPNLEKIVKHVGARLTKPKKDKEWMEVALTYLDEVKSLNRNEIEHIKYMVRDLVENKAHRRHLFNYWNYLQFRNKNLNNVISLKKSRKKLRG